MVFPWDTIAHLDHLKLSPVAALPQEGRQLHLIFALTWSGLNVVITPQPPQEAMRFGRTLNHTTKRILAADPRLGPFYLIKVDPAEAYMSLWVCVKDIPTTSFLIPKKNKLDEQFVGFNLSLPMGFRDSAPFLCRYSETVTDTANVTVLGRSAAHPHPLEAEDRNQALEYARVTSATAYIHLQTLPRRQQ